MEIAVFIVALTASSFVSGALYGRDAEAKAISIALRAEAKANLEVHGLVTYLHARIANLRKYL